MSTNLKPWLGALAATAGLMLMATPPTYARDFGSASATCGDINIDYSPTTLWPPNHKMRTITINATDNDSTGETNESFSVTVASITDNQNEMKGEGCGNVTTQAPDSMGVGNTASGTDPSTVVTSAEVRGERCAREGDRTYDIHVTCTDEKGSSGSTDLFVTVPKHRHPQ